MAKIITKKKTSYNYETPNLKVESTNQFTEKRLTSKMHKTQSKTTQKLTTSSKLGGGVRR